MVESEFERIKQLAINSNDKLFSFINKDRTIDILHQHFQNTLWERCKIRNCIYIISIEYNGKYINLENIENKISNIIFSLNQNNWLCLSNDLEIKNAERRSLQLSNIIEKNIINESKNGHIVFFFGMEGVDYWFMGEKKSFDNVFLSQNNINDYQKREDISKVLEVIKKYNDEELTQRETYGNFFETKSTLNRIYTSKGIEEKKRCYYILRNKPEDRMRKALRNYLSKEIKATFNIEPELGSGKKIDISTEVEDIVYIFEIKWIGQSVDDDGDSFTQKQGATTVRDGYTQTLEYIEEFLISERKSLQAAYLIVFDARKEKTEIMIDKNNIDNKLKQYCDFCSVPPFLTLNNHKP